MSRSRKPNTKVTTAVETPVEVPVVTAGVTAESPPAPVEVKPLRPEVVCFRCGAKGSGKLCGRCAAVLGHAGHKEVRLYSKPVNPMVGW